MIDFAHTLVAERQHRKKSGIPDGTAAIGRRRLQSMRRIRRSMSPGCISQPCNERTPNPSMVLPRTGQLKRLRAKPRGHRNGGPVASPCAVRATAGGLGDRGHRGAGGFRDRHSGKPNRKSSTERKTSAFTRADCLSFRGGFLYGCAWSEDGPASRPGERRMFLTGNTGPAAAAPPSGRGPAGGAGEPVGDDHQPPRCGLRGDGGSRSRQVGRIQRCR